MPSHFDFINALIIYFHEYMELPTGKWNIYGLDVYGFALFKAAVVKNWNRIMEK